VPRKDKPASITRSQNCEKSYYWRKLSDAAPAPA
jgi:hypothetical protein